MDVFVYDNNGLTLNRPEILLVKEFKVLFDRDKSKDKSKVFNEFKYIYLSTDWKTPYNAFSDDEKKEVALLDSDLKTSDIDGDVIKAISKYKELQETHYTKILKSAYRAIDELRLYYDTLDLQERDQITQKPLVNHKDVVSSLQNLGKLVASIKELEHMVKTEQEESKALRGEVQPGLFD